MSEICPEKIIRAITASNPDPGTVNIKPTGKFRIDEILYLTKKPVLFRLLLCREEKRRRKLPTYPQQDNCPFKEHYNLDADIMTSEYACRYDNEKNTAHIYYRHETLQNGEQSCIVAFINRNENEDPADIAQRFINTVDWLKIKNEKPYFRVIYIYNAQIDLDSRYIKMEIQKGILNYLPSIKWDICEIVEVEKGKNKLMINFDNTKFIIEPA